MKINMNLFSHYKFKSCFRTYLLALSSTRYLKTAKKASPDVSASCKQARGGNKNAISSIAACAYKHDATGTFDTKNRRESTLEKPAMCHTRTLNIKTACARSAHVLGHKRLARRINTARVVYKSDQQGASHA